MGARLSGDSDAASARLDALLNESISHAVTRAATTFDEIACPFERQLVLFGAGGLGRRTLAGLRSLGIEPLAFADNSQKLQGATVDGVPVLSVQDAASRYRDSAAFVITVWNGESLDRTADRRLQLVQLGCRRVTPAAQLFWKYPDTFLPYYTLDLPHKVLEEASLVREAFRLWSDERSRREYVSQVAFRLLLDYEGLARPSAEPHYFPPDLFELRRDEVFIDCGAFDGDSIRDLLRLQGDDFERVVAFEPDELTYSRLQAFAAGLPEALASKITCFQQALSNRKGRVSFESTGTLLSAIGAGSTSVECVALDDVVKSLRPTFLKFDIEGAEPLALAGGRETIRKFTPILAVSAYHKQNHLWEIPRAIAGTVDFYRFSLRPHGNEGWDLVCYAIPPARARTAS